MSNEKVINAKHTPGPWHWQSLDGGKSFFLGTANRGRLFVMDFVRCGMQRAVPRFSTWPDMMNGAPRERLGGIMEPAKRAEDFQHPDARLMAAAPDLLAACKAVYDGECHCHEEGVVKPCVQCVLKAAIALAEGGAL